MIFGWKQRADCIVYQDEGAHLTDADRWRVIGAAWAVQKNMELRVELNELPKGRTLWIGPNLEAD